MCRVNLYQFLGRVRLSSFFLFYLSFLFSCCGSAVPAWGAQEDVTIKSMRVYPFELMLGLNATRQEKRVIEIMSQKGAFNGSIADLNIDLDQAADLLMEWKSYAENLTLQVKSLESEKKGLLEEISALKSRIIDLETRLALIDEDADEAADLLQRWDSHSRTLLVELEKERRKCMVYKIITYALTPIALLSVGMNFYQANRIGR